jgi:hypothetical protein
MLNPRKDKERKKEKNVPPPPKKRRETHSALLQKCCHIFLIEVLASSGNSRKINCPPKNKKNRNFPIEVLAISGVSAHFSSFFQKKHRGGDFFFFTFHLIRLDEFVCILGQV